MSAVNRYIKVEFDVTVGSFSDKSSGRFLPSLNAEMIGENAKQKMRLKKCFPLILTSLKSLTCSDFFCDLFKYCLNVNNKI